MSTEPLDVPTLIFRCPQELRGRLPEPSPAGAKIPRWLKDMPAEALSATTGAVDDTVKRCPPFVDAMTRGFLMPLMCDVRVEAGAFVWDSDLPPAGAIAYPRSPIGFHDPGQVAGAPLFDADQVLVKFHNLWTIEAPDGYAVLFTHPLNRFDLPFTTLSGIVDCDRYFDSWVHFPALWRDPTFSGVLPRGTPVAQCIPVKRETWSAQIEAQDEEAMQRTHALNAEIAAEKGVYRRRFRA